MTVTEASKNIGHKVRIVGDDIAMREELRPYIIQGVPLVVKGVAEETAVVTLRDTEGNEFSVPARNIVPF